MPLRTQLTPGVLATTQSALRERLSSRRSAPDADRLPLQLWQPLQDAAGLRCALTRKRRQTDGLAVPTGRGVVAAVTREPVEKAVAERT